MQARVRLTASLTIVAVALGFMVSLSYKHMETMTGGGLSGSTSYPAQKQLQQQLTQLTEANQQAQQQLGSITTQITQYEQRSTGSNSQLQALQKQLSAERILAGSTAVKGPGVEVVLMDGTAVGGNTEQVLTHDWDIRQLVNELFTAGAEAVSINGYRVVATSAVTCIGPVVKVNDNRLGAPFTVDAIGSPQTLQSALMIQGGILDALRSRGVSASQPSIKQNIQMPAFTGALTASPSAVGS